MKIKHEHFHIGQFTLPGSVSIYSFNKLEEIKCVQLVIALSILTCSFFIILYSMEWGSKRANEWLTTMMLSFGQSVLVIDPFKVFLITAITSFLIRQPYNDETLDFNDPFTEQLINKTNQDNLNDPFDYHNNNNIRGMFEIFEYDFSFELNRNNTSTSYSFV